MDCLPPLMKQLESDPCVSNSLAQKHDIKVIKIWRPSVEEHFDDIVAPVDPPMDTIIDDKDDDDAKKKKEVIRNFYVTIKQVLRNDLSEGVR
jgi:hypothetical protein